VVAGSYGYRPVREVNPAKVDRYGEPELIGVRREIDEDQAKWVRQIFQWYAEGWSPRTIVNQLNGLKVPAPGAAYHRRRTGRGGVWSATALHGDLSGGTGILSNPIYIGRLIWNRRQWVRDPETNRKLPRLRPESEWIIKENAVPAIIDKALWDRVQARRKAQANGHHAAPPGGRSPKYALSGLLKCGQCGSNYVIQSYYQYGCAGHKDSGTAFCTNSLKVSRLVAETRLLKGVREGLFTQEGLALFIKKTTHLLAQQARSKQPDCDRAQRRLPEVEREIANVMKAIKAGIFTQTTKAELEKAEAERTRLQGLITAQKTAAKTDKVVPLLPRAMERYEAAIKRVVTLKKTSEAREQLRTLLGEIKLTPSPEGHLEAVLIGHYKGLIKLVDGEKLNNVVAGRGFEPLTFGL